MESSVNTTPVAGVEAFTLSNVVRAYKRDTRRLVAWLCEKSDVKLKPKWKDGDNIGVAPLLELCEKVAKLRAPLPDEIELLFHSGINARKEVNHMFRGSSDPEIAYAKRTATHKVFVQVLEYGLDIIRGPKQPTGRPRKDSGYASSAESDDTDHNAVRIVFANRFEALSVVHDFDLGFNNTEAANAGPDTSTPADPRQPRWQGLAAREEDSQRCRSATRWHEVLRIDVVAGELTLTPSVLEPCGGDSEAHATCVNHAGEE
ncbi:hypothetical protein QBC35DRAFT_467499 [Podospora australis]|uniref:DUF6604 domain-containing protein n=1 Tax=Podospora australis TaxID=1536484 RepID=A0AAN6WN35_9PEZI|nr:hypothetical protein QBC35DRAFT_467499 [Podospora australis]